MSWTIRLEPDQRPADPPAAECVPSHRYDWNMTQEDRLERSEEARKGFQAIPTQPANPNQVFDSGAGMPAPAQPDPAIASPVVPEAPAQPADNPTE